ncbi:hypothetical protein ACFY7C_36705 [Streptomyces sp. NPDC012769]|uniref:hypothetical protein n=1 Tax=Streptomyces sp. NPDC012769 TaxID=3364848 RepID=UPI0036AFAA8B
MSWFSGHNVDDIADNPNELPNNTYKFQVISAEVKPTKDNSKTGITFKYQIMEGAYANFFPLTDWVRVPDANTKPDEIERILSYLKMRLIAFGFSPDEIANMGPETIAQTKGRMFYGNTSLKRDEKSGQANIRVIRFNPLNDDQDMSDLSGFSTDDDRPF